MSYILIISEVRRGLFEERNLDSIGLCNYLEQDAVLLIPEGNYVVNDKLVQTIIKTAVEETTFLNPMAMMHILQKAMDQKGKPEAIVFTSSSSGGECAAYAAGYFNLPLVTDVSACDKEKQVFYKSYFSDKIFGEFKLTGEKPCILTVRSGSFKTGATEKAVSATVETIESISPVAERSFVEYVEEEKADVDITKAEFLLSVGRGIGSQDEIPNYEELAGILTAVLSGSRPVIDKQWLPKPRQVGTSGKTVKPKVYLAMGISGAFQHIAGMKDSDCIIAVNKDAEAPIFQYAHFGIVADIHKVRDKLKAVIKG